MRSVVKSPCHPLASLLLAMLLVLPSTSCARRDDFDRHLTRVVRPSAFSIVRWEWLHLGQAVKPFALSQVPLERRAGLVRQYVDLGQQISVSQREREASQGTGKVGCPACDGEEWGRLVAAREELRPAAQAVLADQVAEALRAEGVGHPAPFGLPVTLLFPPVRFVFDDLPLVLVISPRDRIDSAREVLLVSGLTAGERTALERRVESLQAAFAPHGVSALVEDIGGFGGTYPAFVHDGALLENVISIVAEEWTHQYLAFTPLGRRYILDLLGWRRDYGIARLNEAVAGMVADEIQERVLRGHYGMLESSVPPRANGAPEGDAFSFRSFMRETRRVVDEMLGRGEIDAAEAYMEARRQELQGHGYYIRRLNQAYFAFHGTYVDGAAAVDPETGIDPVEAGLRALRSQSASVGDFVRRAGRLTSLEQLKAMVAP